VVGIASSALFDLGEADLVFRRDGTEAYREYQRAHETEILAPGVAFPLVRALLSLNGAAPADRLIEVVLLSRNDPDTGLRVFNTIEHHGLDITRAAFVRGGTPFRYLEAFNVSLFLSANQQEVKEAVMRGAPAGQVRPGTYNDFGAASELRVAFDFDGIIADDTSEAVFKADGLEAFQRHETEHAAEPAKPGPLSRFFRELARIQKIEQKRESTNSSYVRRVRTAIVTARNAPAHKRVLSTLRDWGIEVDEVFFLGGVDKAAVLKEFRPHIFFDDQMAHVESVSKVAPSVRVPFGVANAKPSPDLVLKAAADAVVEDAACRGQPPHVEE
jgi:5'-nucleotidase